MRVTIPKLLGLGFSVMLGGYVFVMAPQMPGKIASHITHAIGGGQARASTARSAPLFPPPGKKFVGIMTSRTDLLHANGHFMQATLEPLAVAVARIAALDGPVTAVRRLRSHRP